MELSRSTKRPPAVPVCERCRRRRQKCDTTELSPCRACIGAGVECLISEPDGQTSLPRIYVQSLEEQAEKLRQRLKDAKNRVSHGAASQRSLQVQRTPEEFSFPMSPGAASESLIDNLFNHSSYPESSSKVKLLVQDLGQVSLSAMSAPETGQSHTAALQRLILGIAGVPSLEGDHRSAPMPLPDKAIAQRVCARYCQDILPGLPFTTTSAILSHLRTAYDDSSPYSAFLIGTILATTAVYLSPASTPNAVGLYRTGLSYLEFWFNTSLKVDMIQYLEASVVLAQFGSFVGDEYVDTWSLSGLAVRIAVDLGLHKSCETESKRRLFWSAYALDRKKAVIDDLPVAMSDRAVEAELPRTPQYHPFELYRILSEIHNLKDPVTRVRLETLKTTLDHWNQDYQASAQSPSRLLQSDHGLAVSSLEKWFIAAYDTH